MTDPDANLPEEIMWQGKFVTAKRRGRWEYASRSRGIRAAAIVAIDDEGHVLLVEQYRVPLGRVCLEIPAGEPRTAKYPPRSGHLQRRRLY